MTSVHQILDDLPHAEAAELLAALNRAGIFEEFDGECVAHVDGYEQLIDSLLALTGGTLVPRTLSFIEGEPRIIRLTKDGVSHTVEVRGNTDWADIEALLPFLNDLLAAHGAKQRLRQVWSSELFGQCFGVAWVTDGEADLLYHAGLPIALDSTGARVPILPASGKFAGHPAVGFDADELGNSDEALSSLLAKLCRLTGGVLDPANLSIDRDAEVLRAKRGRKTMCVSTLDDDTESNLADGAGYALVQALNRLLERIGESRVFCMLFGPRPDSWVVVFVTPEEDEELRNEHN